MSAVHLSPGPDRRSDHGFTLIELLVVIVILGVLGAIAIPTFLAQRAEGYDAQATADVRQLQMVIEDARDAAGLYPVGLPAYKKSSTTSSATYVSSGTDFCVSVRSSSGSVFKATSVGAAVGRSPSLCATAAG